MRNCLTILIAMSFCFFGLAQDNGSSEVEKSDNKSQIGFGVYSSVNVYVVKKLSNGLFVSKGKFRLIGLLDISKFYYYEESYSVCGGQLQIDYSLLKNSRFNPYIGLNFNHVRYTDGGGQHTSHQFNNPDFYEPYSNTFDNSINLVAGLDAKVYKGISVVTHLGSGIGFIRQEVRNIDPAAAAIADPVNFLREILISIGLKINVNEFLR